MDKGKWILCAYSESDCGNFTVVRWVDIFDSLEECERAGKSLALDLRGKWKLSCIEKFR